MILTVFLCHKISFYNLPILVCKAYYTEQLFGVEPRSEADDFICLILGGVKRKTDSLLLCRDFTNVILKTEYK